MVRERLSPLALLLQYICFGFKEEKIFADYVPQRHMIQRIDNFDSIKTSKS